MRREEQVRRTVFLMGADKSMHSFLFWWFLLVLLEKLFF